MKEERKRNKNGKEKREKENNNLETHTWREDNRRMGKNKCNKTGIGVIYLHRSNVRSVWQTTNR